MNICKKTEYTCMTTAAYENKVSRHNRRAALRWFKNPTSSASICSHCKRKIKTLEVVSDMVNGSTRLLRLNRRDLHICIKVSSRRTSPRLHRIGSKWNRIPLDPVHFLRGVGTESSQELFAFERGRIQMDLR